MKSESVTRSTPKFSTIKARDLIESFKSGGLIVPEFQRPFVWKSGQIVNLLDSIYKDFPIPSILLLDAPSDRFEHRTETPALKARVRFIIDGQQRITALTLPERDGKQVCFNLESEQFRYVTHEESTQSTQLIPLKDVWGGKGARTASRNGSQTTPTMQKRLKRVKDMLNAHIPVTTINNGDPSEVIDIFRRINTGGKKLTPADIECARLAAKHPSFIRQEFMPFLIKRRDEGFPIISLSLLFQACNAVAHEPGTGRDATVFLDLTRDQINPVWKRTTAAVLKVVSFLKSELSIHNSSVLWSGSALIPLIVAIAVTKQRDQPEIKSRMMVRWLILCAATGRFGKASETDLKNDVNGILSSKAPQNFLATSIREMGKKANIQSFAKKKMDGRWKFLLYTVLAHNKCVDPLTGEKIIFTNDVDFHHIFPRSLYVNPTISDRIDNLVCIKKDTNRNKYKSTPPEKYLSTVKEADLKLLCIPESHWQQGEENRFWLLRARLLDSSLHEFLAALARS